MQFTFDWLHRVNRHTLRCDLTAGLTGAVLALPQGMAYAMIAGMPPETGLYSAIIVAAIAALLGSSWHMISGPAAAISIVLMSIVSTDFTPGSPEFISTVIILTLMIGIIQIALGVLKLGALINFISHTVVIGFTAGAAILITASQLRYLLELDISGGNLFHTLEATALHLSQSNLYALAIGMATLLTAATCRYLNRRLPHLLIGLLVGALLGQLLDAKDHGVTMLDALSSSLPGLHLPSLSLDQIGDLASGAFAVAILGLIEAVSIARALATRSHQIIDGNREFIAQGAANGIGSLFGCFAGSGSFTRSGANYDSGAKTPLAALFNALLIALVLFSFPTATAYLPMPAMAGSIILIAWNLIDRHHIRHILSRSRSDTIVLGATFLATLLFNLEFSIYIGVLLSLGFYLRRTSQPNIISVAPNPNLPRRKIRNIHRYHLPQCPQARIIRIDGSMFFGAVAHVQERLRQLATEIEGPPHILIIGKAINFIDISAFEMLLQEQARLKAEGGSLMFCSFKGTVMDELKEKGVIDEIGADLFYTDPEDALKALIPEFDRNICDHCTVRIFNECPPEPDNRIEVTPVTDSASSRK